jgi:PAS domain-containing protein
VRMGADAIPGVAAGQGPLRARRSPGTRRVAEYAAMAGQQSLDLILARNLISGIKLAAFLIDPDGVLVFFNDAAGELIGRRFEEVGRLNREEWNSQFGPFDEFGQLVPTDSMPLTKALRDGLPANGCFRVSSGEAENLIDVEVSALPLTTADGFQGAIIVFWRAEVGGPPDS